MRALLLLVATLASGMFTCLIFIVKTAGGGRPWIHDILDTPFGWPFVVICAATSFILFMVFISSFTRT